MDLKTCCAWVEHIWGVTVLAASALHPCLLSPPPTTHVSTNLADIIINPPTFSDQEAHPDPDREAQRAEQKQPEGVSSATRASESSRQCHLVIWLTIAIPPCPLCFWSHPVRQGPRDLPPQPPPSRQSPRRRNRESQGSPRRPQWRQGRQRYPYAAEAPSGIERPSLRRTVRLGQYMQR